MAEAGDEYDGTTQDHVLGDVSHHCDHMRHLVVVRAHRPHDRRDPRRRPRMAVLDKVDRCRDWIHRRTRVHVRSVQDVRTAMSAMARIQPHHIYTEPADAGQKGFGARHRDDRYGHITGNKARGAHSARDGIVIGLAAASVCIMCSYVCVYLLYHLKWPSRCSDASFSVFIYRPVPLVSSQAGQLDSWPNCCI